MENFEEERELTEVEYNELLKVRRDKLASLTEQGKDPFLQTVFPVNYRSEKIKNDVAKLEGKKVRIAGRMISKRVMGKASFAHVLDTEGTIQIYVKIDNVGAEEYEEFKKYDIGDIIGICGKVFVTHKGEVSVSADKLVLLSKSLLPLPEKWHGLKDNDLRYRQRYVDLIANPEVKKTFLSRSKIISALRRCLDKKGFVEVETPILNTIPGGATARPFITHHNTLDIDMYMRIALELYLKRLIIGGFEKVYEVGRVFRNEGMDIKHNPEFTMMELYQAYTDLYGIMDLTEDIFSSVMKELGLSDEIGYQGRKINMKLPWKRLTMIEAVKQYTGLDYGAVSDDDKAIEMAKKYGVELDDKKLSWGYALYETFDQFVEDKLIDPVFITDYPIEISPLAKKMNNDKRLVYRFELFMNTWEMGNAYTELNDPIDQKERFEAQMALRAKGDDEAQMYDDDFITAMEYGMPPTGGLGLGIDRMVMLLTDNASIRDVLLFPTMKPKK